MKGELAAELSRSERNDSISHLGENGLSFRICPLALELIVKTALIFDTELPALIGNEGIDFECSGFCAMPETLRDLERFVEFDTSDTNAAFACWEREGDCRSGLHRRGRVIVDVPEREPCTCGTGFAGVPIEQFGYFILGGSGWLPGIRVGGIEPHAIIAANFIAIFEIFDPIHPLGSEHKGEGFVGDEDSGRQLVNMLVGKILSKNVTNDAFGTNSLEFEYNRDIDSLKHIERNAAVGKSLSYACNTLLGGDALCAYLVVVPRKRLNQILGCMMDKPCGFMRNENRGIH